MPLSPTLFSALLASASIRLKMLLQYWLPRRGGIGNALRNLHHV